MEGGKLIKIPLDKTDDYDAWTANEFPVSLYSGTVESATWVGENIFAVTMFNDDTTHFLFLVDTKGSKYTDVGFNIEDGCDGERLSKTIVYGPNSGVFYNEKLCKLAYTCGEGRYFEIMTLKNGSISDRKVVFGDMPKYKTVKEGSYILYKLDDSEKRGITACSTQEAIYITYTFNSDLKGERSDGYPGYFHDMIDVFDWDGNRLSRLRTEKPFQHFIVSKDDKKLYTISLDLTTKKQEIDEYEIREKVF